MTGRAISEPDHPSEYNSMMKMVAKKHPASKIFNRQLNWSIQKDKAWT